MRHRSTRKILAAPDKKLLDSLRRIEHDHPLLAHAEGVYRPVLFRPFVELKMVLVADHSSRDDDDEEGVNVLG
jgi:hypothetical protein